jgi:hypothetical protein
MDVTGQDDIRAVERRAAARARLSPGGIGAAVAERSGVDPDGREHLRVRISDGRYFGWLAVIAGSGSADPEAVEQAVERRAADLPETDRLDATEALSPFEHE